MKLYYAGLEKQTELPMSGHQPPVAIPLVREKRHSFTIDENSGLWDRAVEALKNEIQVRHYYFAEGKNPETITVEDVKAFLTFLAVKKRFPLLPKPGI